MTKDQIQGQALEATKGKLRCSVVLGTGVGKTLVGLNHMEQNTTALMRLLIVAPKKAIFQSWKDDALKFNKEVLLERVTFSTYLSLNKQDPKDYDIVYLDEVHNLLDSHRAFLSSYKGKLLGLTGTPPKYRNSEKGKIVNEYCPVVFTFKADDAVENKILNDYQIVVHEINLSHNKNYQIETRGKKFFTSEYQNYLYWGNRIDTGDGPSHILRIMRDPIRIF